MTVVIQKVLARSNLPRILVRSEGAAEDGRAPTEERSCVRVGGFCPTELPETLFELRC
jgi:hypothetical protein